MGGSSACRKWGLVGSNEIIRAVSLREYWDRASPVLNVAQLRITDCFKLMLLQTADVCVREEQTQVSRFQLYWSQCGVLCAQHDLCPFYLQVFWTPRRSFFLIEYCLEMNVLTRFLKQETLGTYLTELLWRQFTIRFPL